MQQNPPRALNTLGTSLLLLTAAIVLAACGGEEGGNETAAESSATAPDPTTSSEGGFVEQANSICREFSVDVRATREEVGPAVDAKGAIEVAEAISPLARERMSALEGLDPGDGVADAYEEFVAAENRRLDAFQQSIEALRNEDRQALRQAQQSSLKARTNSLEAASEAGLEVCGGELPEQTVAAVEESIRRTATSNDPKLLCDELVTEDFVEIQFGGPTRCEAIQRRAPAPPEKVEISNVIGVEGVSAEADIALEGGRQDGQRARISLVFEDGTWKVDRIAPLGRSSGGGSQPAPQIA